MGRPQPAARPEAVTVSWDAVAATALTEEIDRLEQYSSAAVERFVSEIRATMERLDVFPESGRMVPEFGHRQVRETFVGRFGCFIAFTPTAWKSARCGPPRCHSTWIP